MGGALSLSLSLSLFLCVTNIDTHKQACLGEIFYIQWEDFAPTLLSQGCLSSTHGSYMGHTPLWKGVRVRLLYVIISPFLEGLYPIYGPQGPLKIIRKDNENTFDWTSTRGKK